jgi:predicted dehydrogenase
MAQRDSERVKFAIVGCGSVSGNRYFPNLSALAAGELVAVCDVAPARAEARAREFGVACYTDLDGMLAGTEFDLLVNLTNVQSHFAVNLKALQAGRHVYTQKPMTTSYADATTLVEEAARRNLKLVAEESSALNPYNRTVRRLIQAGIIGKVLWARSACTHNGPATIDNWPTDPAWFYKKGAGPLWDVGVERLHLLTTLLGPAKRVTAMSGRNQPEVTVRGGPNQGQVIAVEQDDVTLITLDFGDATFAMLDAAYTNFSAYRTPDLEIYGGKGVITSLGRSHEQILWLFRDEPALGIRGWEEIQQIPPAKPVPPLRALGLAHAIECIQTDTPPIASGEHARHCIEIIEKVYVAAHTGVVQTMESTF